MNKILRNLRFGGIGILLFVSVVFVGCGSKDKIEKNKDGAVILRIPSYRAGENIGAKFFLPQVARFNEEYKGKYEMIIEETPQHGYFDKIKLLQQQDKLPPLVEGGDPEYIRNVIIKNDLFYDLSSWLKENPEVRSVLIKDSVDYNTTPDGKIVSLPYAVTRSIALYYNKEMFQKAGITKPLSQMSLSEFDGALAQLKENGFTPLALMTGENAWTTTLIFSAVLANTGDGLEILRSPGEFLYDYTGQAWIRSFAKLREYFQKYTTKNAVGAVYADAANNFMNERTAMIANGPWMVGDFSNPDKASAGFDKKVGAEIYPGGIGIARTTGYYWWIPKNLPEKVRDGALAFMKFIDKPEELRKYMVAEGGNAPHVPLTKKDLESLNPILADLSSSLSKDEKALIPRLGDKFPAQIANKEFGRLLPKLVDGSLSPEAFGKELTAAAAKFKK